MTAPRMPEMRWDKDGKPDFSHPETNEANQPSIREQLETLIGDDYDHSMDTDAGDFTKVRELYPDSVIYEVHRGGESEIFKQSYAIEEGEVSLEDDGERVPPEQFAILSRRRIPRHGVPPMATGEDEG